MKGGKAKDDSKPLDGWSELCWCGRAIGLCRYPWQCAKAFYDLGTPRYPWSPVHATPVRATCEVVRPSVLALPSDVIDMVEVET